MSVVIDYPRNCNPRLIEASIISCPTPNAPGNLSTLDWKNLGDLVMPSKPL